MTPAKIEARNAWSPMLALAVTAVVLLGLPWGLKLTMAPEIGEPCGGGFDCRALDGRCVAGEHGRFCTVTCEDDAACPRSSYCGTPPHDRWLRWFSTSELSERFCVPGPGPLESFAPPDINADVPRSRGADGRRQ